MILHAFNTSISQSPVRSTHVNPSIQHALEVDVHNSANDSTFSRLTLTPLTRFRLPRSTHVNPSIQHALEMDVHNVADNPTFPRLALTPLTRFRLPRSTHVNPSIQHALEVDVHKGADSPTFPTSTPTSVHLLQLLWRLDKESIQFSSFPMHMFFASVQLPRLTLTLLSFGTLKGNVG